MSGAKFCRLGFREITERGLLSKQRQQGRISPALKARHKNSTADVQLFLVLEGPAWRVCSARLLEVRPGGGACPRQRVH